MTQQENNFSGIWHCRYWFPSNNHPGEDVSEYYAEIERSGRQFVLHSLSNAGETEGSYLLAKFAVDGDLVSGSWWENTSPAGEFAGSIYSGTFQLLLDKSSTRMEGKWVGIGQDHGVRKIYTGRWEIARINDKTAAKLQKTKLENVRT